MSSTNLGFLFRYTASLAIYIKRDHIGGFIIANDADTCSEQLIYYSP